MGVLKEDHGDGCTSSSTHKEHGSSSYEYTAEQASSLTIDVPSGTLVSIELTPTKNTDFNMDGSSSLYMETQKKKTLQDMKTTTNAKVVAVSGGFDPIHSGHILLFKEAWALGTELVVLLNSDEFLERKKGKPFMSWDERRTVLESIRYISQVYPVIDTDQTVCKTLEMIRPDIFANGGDRVSDNTPEVDVCRKMGIEMVFNVGGKKLQSSSNLLKKWSHTDN